ncbi:MAG TPA: sulfurtransferase TusA family protein [Nitrospiria bacterium]|jgi:TusA-related sulfurtransferase
MEADMTLDAMGLFCPMPIVLTAKKIKELKIGQILEVLNDDEGIIKDMPAWCKNTGNEFIELVEEEGSYRIYVKKLVE